MEQIETNAAPRSVTSYYPALVILVFAIAVFVVAQGYSEISRRFPVAVALGLGALALIDLWSRSKLPGSAFIVDFFGTGFERREMVRVPALAEELKIGAWILGFAAVMSTIGILVAIPIFCTLFTWRYAGKSLTLSLGVGSGVLLFVYAVFELALDYPLYRGLLFAEGGLSSW